MAAKKKVTKRVPWAVKRKLAEYGSGVKQLSQNALNEFCADIAKQFAEMEIRFHQQKSKQIAKLEDELADVKETAEVVRQHYIEIESTKDRIEGTAECIKRNLLDSLDKEKQFEKLYNKTSVVFDLIQDVHKSALEYAHRSEKAARQAHHNLWIAIGFSLFAWGSLLVHWLNQH